MDEAERGGPARPRGGRGRCPICGREPAAPYRPFCSARCAQIDLGRWLAGAYALPTEDAPPTSGGAEDEPWDR
ncbi:DNA gyrase inhibitor YacG [Caldovatus aquaticus]|uniref:DNA gyrase inhibitor YacG n=1 Tax=Caldovatus aquaticus TaxID=2865671 RepID=A0ABS7EXW8_9PROT|nr:DNA gyrase inhibitor YacG [Caldovatus aquaticus]MBW8267943.1 DNA gyrase inhibitor YacG [Caldovatus aquaticus]